MSPPPQIKKPQKQTKNQNETKGNQKKKPKQKQEIKTCISKQKNLANSLLVTYLM